MRNESLPKNSNDIYTVVLHGLAQDPLCLSLVIHILLENKHTKTQSLPSNIPSSAIRPSKSNSSKSFTHPNPCATLRESLPLEGFTGKKGLGISTGKGVSNLMDEIWERAIETAPDGQIDYALARTLTLDGAVKCVQGRLPPPSLLEKFQNLQHLSIANIRVSSLEPFPRGGWRA
ncbi:hypothetical protein PanWU01x14_042530 [Parasponia andersonii]|uniref:LRR domain containing protein n=1 Tax=Parasponia andersonii TaxID=3476 RepID=A0A2P5DQR9_PARAD|nr:hypothetical protein PanWU01x14_042530 [Parasponia andersonii]